MLKNKISILIVDDEIDICETVSAILSDEGYKTITAFNSIDAVNIIKKK